MSNAILTIEVNPKDFTKMSVEINAASGINFTVAFDGETYHQTIADICAVAPHMMALDADLTEAFDDAFRTQPKTVDIVAVKAFLTKYRGRVDENLPEMFDLKWKP